MKDKDFLFWLAKRIIHVYGESPSVDFVWKLNAIAETIPEEQDTPLLALHYKPPITQATTTEEKLNPPPPRRSGNDD